MDLARARAETEPGPHPKILSIGRHRSAWKDIYEALEEAVDACDTAAHRVGNILVKNA